MRALKKCSYERFSISPSISGYRRGIIMNVYAAKEVHKVYPYGENGKVHGYICPESFLKDHNTIRKMIGYNGPIIIIDSEGNNVAH